MAEISSTDPNQAQHILSRQHARLNAGAEMPVPQGPNVQRRSSEVIDPNSVVDFKGNPLQYGNTDPNIIGPDDIIPELNGRNLRDRSKYSQLHPPEMFVAEEKWILPLGASIANHIGVDLIDETAYHRIQKQLKQQFLFCVLDISHPRVGEDVVNWGGIKLFCKEYLICEVTFRLGIRARSICIPTIRLWVSATQKYVMVGDPLGQKGIDRSAAAQIIANYLHREKILA